MRVRVAVTGHRDLSEATRTELRPLVETSLRSVLASCQPAEVELLTGLADGADRLATEVARNLGVAIHVVLPKPAAIYRGELSPAGQALLDEMLEDPGTAVTTIGVDPDQGAEGEADETGSEPYLRLGVYLAESAHVLLALWDGSFERKPGGSFDVLARFLDRTFYDAADDQPDPLIEAATRTQTLTGPTALWIDAPRGNATPDTPPDSRYLIASGSPGMWLSAADMPGCLSNMLIDAGATSKLYAAHSDGLAPGYPLLEDLPPDADPSQFEALEEIQQAYLNADALAMVEQARSDRSFILASWIAAAMGFAFLWFAKIDAENIWLYGYLGLFIGGYLLFRFARDRNWLRQHLSLRILAETLRVRFFGTLLGVSDQIDVRRLLSLTGVASFPGLAWAVEADRIGVPTTGVQPQPALGQMPLVRSEWVDDQARYFENKIEKLEARHKRLETTTRLLYVLSGLTVVALLVVGTQLKKEYLWDDVSAKTFLVFLMGLLPLWLTIWELHQGRMATRELLWQFRNQADLFARASLQLRWVRDGEAQVQVFVELAERSLFEAYLWTIHRFHREFEPPSGG